jgi:hypothetical protein
MRISGAVKAGLTALMLLAAAPAIGAPTKALPGQPLVQAPRVCAMGIVAINRRCRVIDFTKLGTIDHREWYYAFYATHWADRHGRMDRGFPVIFYLQRPATLRQGLLVNDAPGLADKWALTPPPRPVLIKRPAGTYLGLTLKAVRGPADQRLFKLDKIYWRYVEIFHHPAADQAKIDAVIPRNCQATTDELYDWATLRLRTPLIDRDGGKPCGAVISEIDLRQKGVTIASSTLDRAPAPLTP